MAEVRESPQSDAAQVDVATASVELVASEATIPDQVVEAPKSDEAEACQAGLEGETQTAAAAEIPQAESEASQPKETAGARTPGMTVAQAADAARQRAASGFTTAELRQELSRSKRSRTLKRVVVTLLCIAIVVVAVFVAFAFLYPENMSNPAAMLMANLGVTGGGQAA